MLIGAAVRRCWGRRRRREVTTGVQRGGAARRRIGFRLAHLAWERLGVRDLREGVLLLLLRDER